MDSETDLLEAIKVFLSAGSLAQLFPQLLELGLIEVMTNILSHENTDIVMEGISLLNELLEEEEEDIDDEKVDATNQGNLMLARAIANSSVLEIIVQYLSKLDETKNEEKEAVYQILGIF